MRSTWHKLAAFSLAVALLLLVAHPAAGVALIAALVLTPVTLFGLVLVPHSLCPAADPAPLRDLPIFCRAGLFQRPPPSSIL